MFRENERALGGGGTMKRAARRADVVASSKFGGQEHGDVHAGANIAAGLECESVRHVN